LQVTGNPTTQDLSRRIQSVWYAHASAETGRLPVLCGSLPAVFSSVVIKAQNESASALAMRIAEALKTEKPGWKYIGVLESGRVPLVPNEKRVLVGVWSGPESRAQDTFVSVYSVDSRGKAAKFLGPFRDKQVAPRWTATTLKIGDEGYLSKYKNGDRFEIMFRKGTVVARFAGNDLNRVKEFARCVVEKIPAS
jgi:hypothetical protein